MILDNDGNIIGYLPDDPGTGGGLVAQAPVAPPQFGKNGIIVPDEDHPARLMYFDTQLLFKQLMKMIDKNANKA